MNIGVDAYYLYAKNNTGVGTFNLNIICELAKIDKKNRYYLYTPGVFHAERVNEITRNANFHIAEVGGWFFKSRRLWLQGLGLRRRVIQDGIDLFWSVGEYVPLLLPEKIKCVTGVYDMVYKLFPETQTLFNKLFYKTLFPLGVKRSDAILTISEDSKRDIVKYLKVDPKKIHAIIIGINVGKFTPPKNIKKGHYILFVGTLQPRKNLENLLRAFTILSHKSGVELVVVGASGWKNSGVSAIVENMAPDVRARIDFKGYLGDNDLVDLYRKARLFAAPSLHEGFGLIILEALASGTPVVTTRRGAIPEIFEDSVVYADPLSPEDIAEKISSILDNESRQVKMIKYGLAYANKHDIKEVAKKYYEVLNGLV